ncbi:MAG: cytochrome c [Caldilineaceae bacterium]|nr:cytochrome c [Caldilineaceae bacterium]
MRINVLCLLCGLLWLVGCGTPSTPPPPAVSLPPGDAERGAALFQQTLVGSRPEPGCATCHSLQPGTRLVGPSLAGIATSAEAILADANYQGTAETVADYLHESLVAPDIYVVPSYPAGVMRPTYGTALTAQEQADLVAYLLTLE